MHIENLAKKQHVLMFKRVYALLKVHGTSAHVSYKRDENDFTKDSLKFYSGGEKYDNFILLFKHNELLEKFRELGHPEITVFGEAYGGKQQGMSSTYGKDLKFIAFDVKIGDHWLAVPNAEKVSNKLGIEFVPYEEGPATVEWLNAQRDIPDRIAAKLGLGDKPAEGIVIRPLMEFNLPGGDRIIAKHKRDDFSERASKKDTNIQDPDKLMILTKAQEIADEWITPMRLEHVLQKFPEDVDTKSIPDIIKAMKEDVIRESEGEAIITPEALKLISTATAKLFVKRQYSKIKE
jgi:hypothetical protein